MLNRNEIAFVVVAVTVISLLSYNAYLFRNLAKKNNDQSVQQQAELKAELKAIQSNIEKVESKVNGFNEMGKQQSAKINNLEKLNLEWIKDKAAQVFEQRKKLDELVQSQVISDQLLVLNKKVKYMERLKMELNTMRFKD